jgi:hypothetical protein
MSVLNRLSHGLSDLVGSFRTLQRIQFDAPWASRNVRR